MAGGRFSQAVLREGRRRQARAIVTAIRQQWFVNQVVGTITLTLRQRMVVAVELIKRKVIVNISRPVTKSKGVRSGRIVVTNRSKPGEFPKADTAQLMRGIFRRVLMSRGVITGIVGSNMEYSKHLENEELKTYRSFLLRTLRENDPNIIKIFTGRIL